MTRTHETGHHETGHKGAIGRVRRSLRRWWAAQRLSTELACLSDRELNRLLAEVGLGRGDLFSGKLDAPRDRRRMGKMLAHFGVDPHEATPRYWDALKDAERVCTHCTQKRRCDRWHDWGVRNNAPFVFCPNARLFDEVATVPRE